MRFPASRSALLLAALALPLCCAGLALAQGPAPSGEPPVLPWSELEYTTRKLFLSASTTAALSLVPPTSAAAELRASPSGTPLPLPEVGVACLTVTSSLPFGRHEVTRLFFDPQSGAAFGSDKLTTGRRQRHLAARYLKEGVYTWSWTPAGKPEEDLGPARWTALQERLLPYPTDLPVNAVVTDAYALLVLTSAMRPGAATPMSPLFVLSYHGFLALDFIAGGADARRVDLEAQTPSGTRRRSGREQLAVLRVSTRAVPANPVASPHDLEVLGFQGGITLLVDPATGVALALKGKADYVGTLTSELVRIRLAAEPQSPSPEGQRTSPPAHR
jgi:hypothetical protein